jgi:hypothetical protein
MRESQMKKIIAAAVATAFVAPAFAADVSVSGDVEYVYISGDTDSYFDSGDQDIVVTGTEEIDGMTVSASIEMDGTEDSNNSDSSLKISQGSVTFEIGDATGSAIEAFDEKSDKSESGGTSGEVSDGATHTAKVTLSPAEGLAVALSHGTTAAGAGANELNSYALQYSAMGATIAYGTLEQETEDKDVTAVSISYSAGPVSIGYDNIENVGHVANTDQTNIGLAYNYGAGNLFIESGEVDTSGDKVETTAVGVSYKMGSLNVYALQNNIEDKATPANDDDQVRVGVEYAF